MELVLAVVAGAVVGVVVALVAVRRSSGAAGAAIGSQVAEAIATIQQQADAVRKESIALAAERVAAESGAKLGDHSRSIASTLAAQRDAFEHQTRELRDQLERLRDVNDQKFDAVSQAVAVLADQTKALSTNTQSLNNALANPQSRGSWGEKMLEDILMRSDMIKGVNYEVQDVLEGGGRPDYTFNLPPDKVLFLDSKFPLQNYLKYHQATTEYERKAALDQFLLNVEQRITELDRRDYVAQAGQAGRQAIEYVLLFIPNESVLAFVQQHKPSILDDAVARKIVLCSPMLLLTFLGVVRQAAQSFAMQENANEVLRLLAVFSRQWRLYVKHLGDVRKHFVKMEDKMRAMTEGKIMTSMRRPLDEIDRLAHSRSITVGDDVLGELNTALAEVDGGEGDDEA